MSAKKKVYEVQFFDRLNKQWMRSIANNPGFQKQFTRSEALVVAKARNGCCGIRFRVVAIIPSREVVIWTGSRY